MKARQHSRVVRLTRPASRRCADSVVFEPLPVIRNGGRPIADDGILLALPMLRRRPHEWARVRTFPAGEVDREEAKRIANAVNAGKHSLFKKDYTACVRTRPDGSIAVYMRFVGEDPASFRG